MAYYNNLRIGHLARAGRMDRYAKRLPDRACRFMGATPDLNRIVGNAIVWRLAYIGSIFLPFVQNGFSKNPGFSVPFHLLNNNSDNFFGCFKIRLEFRRRIFLRDIYQEKWRPRVYRSKFLFNVKYDKSWIPIAGYQGMKRVANQRPKDADFWPKRQTYSS